MIKQKVRIEIREDGFLNKMCEGSLSQAIAFLQALDAEQTGDKEQTAQPDGQGKDTNPL